MMRDLEKELLRGIPKEESIKVQEEAKKFIESQQGAGDVYAKIIQKKLYNDFSNEDQIFLDSIRTFEELKEKYGNKK